MIMIMMMICNTCIYTEPCVSNSMCKGDNSVCKESPYTGEKTCTQPGEDCEGGCGDAEYCSAEDTCVPGM